eukprot:TRINITY_DN3266_c0_g1_i1.p1 TRINITY_DN3266_c0_g1~~TRINITY_DN3266_c0_g1_i1.p1  ORF type:complete len:222 (+),score=31.03 TRINITY_DN3266_c0_g1_i1:41-706(+)
MRLLLLLLFFLLLQGNICVNFSPQADLPPLLEFIDGRPVTTQQEWEQRKEEIKSLFIDYYIGTFPPSVPTIKSVKIISEFEDRNTIDRTVQLTFDTVNNASFAIELLIPKQGGPFPVFMTQFTHRRWALVALSRGYIAVLYPGSDGHDSTYVFQQAYPQATWGTISRRAWLGSRALDYIITLPNIIKDQICITGHSRNGKQSLIATAFDTRITAVVSSSAV